MDLEAFVPNTSIIINDPIAFRGTHSPDQARPSTLGSGIHFNLPSDDDVDKPYVQINLHDATNGNNFVKVSFQYKISLMIYSQNDLTFVYYMQNIISISNVYLIITHLTSIPT